MKALSVLLVGLALLLPAAATTVLPMSVEDLARASEFVVEGVAGDSWSAWNVEHSMVFTYTHFQVTRSLKGYAQPNIIIKQMGGHADGYFTKVAGIRRFQPGAEAVLFLHLSFAGDGTFVITGLMQGNFHVSRAGIEATASNGIVSAMQYEGAGRVRSYNGSRMSLVELERRVLQAGSQ